MGLTRLAIARPFLTVLVTCALLLAGIVGWRSLPVDLNPQAELPNVILTAVYPGAGPSTVEELVAKPLEEAVLVVSGVTGVNSVSQEGFCYLYVELAQGTVTDDALQACREAVDRIRGDLPDGLQDPAFARLDINAQPIVFLGVIGDRPPVELRRLADNQLKPRLESITGVAKVEVLGGREQTVRIAVDRDRLLANGLLLSDLLAPLAASSQNVPGGRLRDGDKDIGVRLVGEATSLADLRGIPIPPPLTVPDLSSLRPPPAYQPSRAVQLGDLAEIELTTVDPEVRIRLQQQAAVGLIITKQGDANTVEVSRQVHQVAAAAGLPPDVKVVVARDTAQTVHEALSDVNASILIGILLCALTIFLFLRSLRGTLIVATSIPICLLGTFAPMAFGGHTLNQMTLLGLALSVGILVDDSIVCLEAITWRLRQGEEPRTAALLGRNDIALADTSTTLIDLAVFVPIALMPGVVGQFFRDFGFVVAIAAALSLLAAYTVVPAMAAYWYPPATFAAAEDEASRGWYARLEARYREVLIGALSRPWRTIGLGWLGLLIASLLALGFLGVDFIPSADLSTILVNLELPPGSSVEATERVTAEAEAVAAAIPETETLFTTIGKIETGFGIVDRFGPQYAQVNLTLKDRRGMLDRLLFRGGDLRKRPDGAIAAELREQLSSLRDVRQLQVIPVRGWGGAGAPVDFSLYGDDLDLMAEVGDRIMNALKETEGVINPDVSWRLGQPEVQCRIDRDRARELHVYPGAVARELRACLEGEQKLTLKVGDEHLPVRIRLQEDNRRTAADIARIPVGRSRSRLLTIADVATLSEGAGPTRIDRRNGLRDLNFKAYLADGENLGAVRTRLEAALTGLGLQREGGPALTSPGYPSLRWGWRGDTETLAASAGYMAMTALLGAVLVYGIMAALFNHATLPFTILLSVPMAFAGGLVLLVLTHSSLSIVSGIGMILLISIVVRNAILLLDYTLQQRALGVPRLEAIQEAGARRLRPILMTTMTTILGMLPVALKIGKGAEIRAPMAIAVIGGLALSTLLTLVIIPATYLVVDRWSERR